MSWLLIALAAAAPAWTDAVTYAVDPLAPRQLPDVREAQLQMLCGGGVTHACRWLDGEPLVDLLAERCEEGDADSCLAAAWDREAEAPDASFDTYERLCAEGHERACADVARAALHGIGTWSSRRRARKLAEPLCADGNPHACMVIADLEERTRPLVAERLLTQAIDDGVDGALRPMPDLVRVELRWDMLVRACEAGIGSSCRVMALEKREEALDDDATTPQRDDGDDEEASADEPEDPAADDGAADGDDDEPVAVADMDVEALLERACGLEDDRACLTSILLGVDRGSIDRGEGEDRLRTLCDHGDEQACLEADYLYYGGDVRAFKLGSLHPLFVDRLGTHLTPWLLECYRDQLDREPGFDDPEMTVHAWIDEEGVVSGGTVTTDGPPEYKDCLADQLLDHEIVEGGIGVSPDHAVKVEIPIHFGHEAEIKVASTRASAAGSAEALVALQEVAREEWAEEADACWLENEGSAWDSIFTIRKAVLRRTGELTLRRLFEPSGIDAADACLADMMAGTVVDELFEYDEPVRIYVRFVQPYRHPKPKGFGHGEAKDPDEYMNRDDWGEGSR